MIYVQSDRLIIRRPKPSDLEALLRGWNDPEMTRYTGVRPDARGFITSLLDDANAKQPGETSSLGPWFQYVVEDRSGEVIGDIGVGFGVPGERQVELGYRIHPGHQRRGYAREAVAAIIDHLIQAHAIHRFVAVVASPNLASTGVLRALGFRREGHFRQSFWCNGEWLDDDYFALLAREWRLL